MKPFAKHTEKPLVLWHFKLFTFVFILLAANYHCSQDSNSSREPSPIASNLIVIGEDLSQTFKNFTPLTNQDLEQVCNIIDKSGIGGKIVFVGIGSSTPKGYASCSIKPHKKADKKATASQQYATKAENINISNMNKNAIESFLVKSNEILNQRGQPFTDINGFFEKARFLLEAPGYENTTKWVYINSDGKQSTKITNKVNCDLLPSVEHLILSGWKTLPNCNASNVLLDPLEFIQYFEKTLIPQK